MPGPDAIESCSFQGTAASVRVQGTGTPVFTEQAPFQRPVAASVNLHGAVLKLNERPVGPPEIHTQKRISVERPAEIFPVRMTASADIAYDVTYQAGPPVVVKVAAGGSNGALRGTLAGAPECAKEWCDIVWTGDQKTVTLTLEAPPETPVRLASGFHFVPDDFAKKKPGPEVITLEGARGRLRCGGDASARDVDDARQVWRAGSQNSLALARLDLIAEGLAVEIHNEQSPERSPRAESLAAPSQPPPEPPHPEPTSVGAGALIGAAGAALLGLAVVVGLALARRRRKAISAGSTAVSASAASAPVERTLGSGPPAESSPAASLPAEDTLDASPKAPPQPATLFYSYSRDDEPLRAKLEKHLRILERKHLLKGFYDRMITPGADWQEELDQRLDQADVILLLVSANFLASDYCYGIEMTRALARHERGEATVIPVLLSPCLWKDAPFAKLQILPAGGEPITTWGDKKDEAFVNVAEGIKSAILARRKQQGAREQGEDMAARG